MGHELGKQDGVFGFLGLKVMGRLAGLRRMCYWSLEGQGLCV